MKTAILQTRVDKELKQEADAFFNSIGMDTTTAIRIFLKQTLIQRKIPFEIIQDNTFYSEKNMNALEHSKTQMETGHHAIHELVEESTTPTQSVGVCCSHKVVAVGL